MVEEEQDLIPCTEKNKCIQNSNTTSNTPWFSKQGIKNKEQNEDNTVTGSEKIHGEALGLTLEGEPWRVKLR